jgi:hypothetical protein
LKQKTRGTNDLAAEVTAGGEKACLISMQEHISVNDVAYGALSRILNRMLGLAKKSIHNHTNFAAVVP